MLLRHRWETAYWTGVRFAGDNASALSLFGPPPGSNQKLQKQDMEGKTGGCQVIDAWHREWFFYISGYFAFFYDTPSAFFHAVFRGLRHSTATMLLRYRWDGVLDRDLCRRQCFCAIVGPGSWASNLWLLYLGSSGRLRRKMRRGLTGHSFKVVTYKFESICPLNV